MPSRAADLACVAAGLAAGAGIDLPRELALWRLAGGRPERITPERAPDPAAALGAALERRLGPGERRRGAHFTPGWLADEVVRRAVPSPEQPGTVCDPACGAGAVLLAAGRRLVHAGHSPRRVARDLLWGADIDPLSAAVAEAALALWSGGVAPGPGHVVAGDPLTRGAAAWPAPPAGGFGAVAGNPPFQGQLSTATARSRRTAAALRARFGAPATGPYVDTSALFLLAGAEVTRPGGRVALLQPLSVVAARDAAPVRDTLATSAAPVELYVPPGRPFAASVSVCVPVLEVGLQDLTRWSDRLATLEGVPLPATPPGPTLGSVCLCVGSFRDEYYGLVPHVREAEDGPGTMLVTSGLLDVGHMRWGERPVRFARRSWRRPVVDLDGLERDGGRPWRHVSRLLQPKVVVATQTRVVEAAADHAGNWVPSTPLVSVVPREPSRVAAVTAALHAPPVSAWLAAAGAGSGLARGAFRVTADQLGRLPLPTDAGLWAEGTAAFEQWRQGDAGWEPWAERLTGAYGLRGADADDVIGWWRSRVARPALAGTG